jgi:hypothetical protein
MNTGTGNATPMPENQQKPNAKGERETQRAQPGPRPRTKERTREIAERATYGPWEERPREKNIGRRIATHAASDAFQNGDSPERHAKRGGQRQTQTPAAEKHKSE